MPTLTLKRHRISAKSGVVSYKADFKRGTGTVYFMPNCFAGPSPETIELTADNYVLPVIEAPKAETAPAEPVAAAAADAQ